MDIEEILRKAVEKGASDVFLIAGLPISYRIGTEIINDSENKLLPNNTKEIVTQMYELANNRDINSFLNRGDDDFSFSIVSVSRFRANVYRQRGSIAAVIRIIPFELPDYKKLNIPNAVMNMSKFTNGFMLVTGAASSGKSTTLACLVNAINESRRGHIITIEDPIEFLHPHKKSIVSQREISLDTQSYNVALNAALRQTPDVILLGEIRDSDTIRTAVTAAETGHFVISTLHTKGAANTIDRIIDAFPEQQQQQIRVQLSMSLRGVISQQLIPDLNGKIIPVYEVMVVNNAIRNMIREGKVHQIDTAIFSSGDENMMSMDTSIFNHYKNGIISKDTALFYSTNKEMMEKKINILGH